MRMLITGFEPFGGANVNPSQEIARALHGIAVNGVQVASVVLPVHREDGPACLKKALQEHNPCAVLCFGEASGRESLSLERVAVNLLDYRIPDNAGTLITDEPVVPDGPAAYFTTLPARAILNTLHQAGVPAELSLSAGTYLCNQVLYTLLHTLAQQGSAIPAGFIHVPALPQQAAVSPRKIASMALETSLAGARLAVEIISAHVLPCP